MGSSAAKAASSSIARARYSGAFRRLLKDDGIEIIHPPPRSLNPNAYAERFVHSIREECLNQMFLG